MRSAADFRCGMHRGCSADHSGRPGGAAASKHEDQFCSPCLRGLRVATVAPESNMRTSRLTRGNESTTWVQSASTLTSGGQHARLGLTDLDVAWPSILGQRILLRSKSTDRLPISRVFVRLRCWPYLARSAAHTGRYLYCCDAAGKAAKAACGTLAEPRHLPRDLVVAFVSTISPPN